MSKEKADSKKREIIGIIGAVLVVGLIIANMHSIFGLLSSVFTFGNTGIIKSPNINVYGESGCINEVSLINWGYLQPRETKNVTIYVNNTGNIALNLNLSTENWSPKNAETYINLSSDYSGEEIQPKKVISITLTLTVSESIKEITEFSFDILIIGTEVT